MKYLLYIIPSVLVLYVLWWWFVARNIPKFPPLALDENDPLLINAIKEAKSRIGELAEHFEEGEENIQVKIPFLCNSGETEYLWATVLKIEKEEIEVRYETPPVTHSGKLERIHKHYLNEVIDWIVMNPNQNIGGFTMRVMFQRAREEWGDLPKQLLKEEQKYK